jgi:hypothetical protein
VTILLAPPIFNLNLLFKQRAGAMVLLTVVNAEGQPITNPAGHTAQAQIRATSSPTSPVLFEWNTAGGVGIGTATIVYSADTLTSVLALVLTGAQSTLFTFTNAQWDCFFTIPSTEPVCLAQGAVTVIPATTY